MGKFFFALAVLAGVWCGRASATPCNQAHVFITGEVLTAATLNANPVNDVTCFNNIDNSNIGSNGIFASQINPNSIATATFAGSFGYTFSNGLTVNGTSGLTVGGGVTTLQLTSPVDILHFGNNCGGAQTFSKLVVNGGASTSGINSNFLGGVCNTTNLFSFDSNGSLGLALNLEVTSGEGDFKTLASGANSGTRSFVPPIYTAAGTAVANTLHGVIGSCSISAASQCTITFTGAAVFTSATSFACGGTNSAGSSFIANPVNPTASSITLSTGGGNETGTLSAICIGT